MMNRGRAARSIGVTLAPVVSAGVFMVVAAAAEPPRTADGRPDFNGLWQAVGEANWGLEPRMAQPGPVRELGAAYAAPPSLGVVVGGEIPYRPEARAARDDNYARRLERDPEVKCYLPGVPRATYMPYPFQIIQGDDQVMLLHQYRGAVRTVNLADHSPAPVPSWMGWSNGWFDGETLVVETTGFNGLAWLDRAGNYASDQLQVVERFTHRGDDVLEYEATLTDPSVYTRPWTIRMPLYRRLDANAELLEFKCIEFVEDLIYGDLAKPREVRQ